MGLEVLEKSLKIKFKNKQLLAQALTHKSCKKPYNNERLEFLGDAVLDLVVGEYLYNKFPTANEGSLSKIRASIVNEKGFTKLAEALGIGEHIMISSAEENNDGRKKPSILSNAFEALIGAVYLEYGLLVAQELSIALIEQAYPKIDLITLFSDYKTALQELTQAKFAVTPEYVIVGSTGPDHKKEFTVEVLINKKPFAKAVGTSKKEAEQEAAKKTLETLKKDNV
ncbi:MAG TPA: ribonuclease III [Campylobacterales bacterium]|nr:ribonuclease III [Campylobacterales bacterium]